jgi:predicted nucleotidyltransferase component of viral defense system
MTADRAASIRHKLRDLARAHEEDFDYVLRQYVMQRLLYRLSSSEYSGQFLLKGALLFWVWNEDFHRPTRDIDLLSFGDNDVPHLESVFRQIVSQEEDDGLAFDVDSVSGIEIKEDADYSGVRINGFANLKNARIPFQVDIGYGDAVVPAAEEVKLPVYLDLPAPQLRAYPVYAVIAEKFQAMVMLGIANSRMKDFYDLRVIAHTMILDGNILAQAMKATFETRKTAITTETLTIFSNEFKQDTGKSIQWNAFLNKNNITDEAVFSDIIAEIQRFIEPIYQAISENRPLTMQWQPDVFCWKDE